MSEKNAASIFSSCLLTLLLFVGSARAQDFVTQEVPPLPGRTNPFCASTFGCWLSGVTLPDSGPPSLQSGRAVGLAPVSKQVLQPSTKAQLDPKYEHRSTIAVGSLEVPNVTRLVSSIKRHDLKLVSPRSSDPDFVIGTTIDPPRNALKTKLFTARLLIVAGSNIHSVEDLRDKVVAFGGDGSGTDVGAQRAIRALGVPMRETTLDLDNAIDGVASGDVAAVIVLASSPIKQFQQSSGKAMHLLSWPDNASIPTGATVTKLEDKPYSNLMLSGEICKTLTVDVLLVSKHASTNNLNLLTELQHPLRNSREVRLASAGR